MGKQDWRVGVGALALLIGAASAGNAHAQATGDEAEFANLERVIIVTAPREIADVGRNALRMFDITDPGLDWVALAQGHGVEGVHCTTADQFVAAFGRAMAEKGPHLIAVEC